MRSKFIKSEKNSSNIFTFYFEKPFNFIAGQFIELTLPTLKNYNKRWFTISSSPNEKYLSITTVIQPKSTAFKQALLALKKNDNVDVSMPMGDFVLPKKSNIPLSFIAGGIGITPFLSILKNQSELNENRDITLLYFAKKDAFMPSPTLNKLGNKFIKKPSRISSKEIFNILAPTTLHYIYIAGPENMAEQLTKDFINYGVKSNHIFTDFFSGYSKI